MALHGGASGRARTGRRRDGDGEAAARREPPPATAAAPPDAALPGLEACLPRRPRHPLQHRANQVTHHWSVL